MIYQRGNLKNEAPRSSIEPIMQWLVFIFLAAIVLYILRLVMKRRNRRLTRRMNKTASPDYFLGSFVDSMALFLGVGLNRIGDCRAERWLLISFSVFGLLFNMIYTEYLFAMFTAVNQIRITSIEQLFHANIPIYIDIGVSNDDPEFYIRIRS